MYFKIKNKILFRQYTEYGYITDNNMFGYKFLNENDSATGEKYVSESAAIMLSLLSKKPQHIDSVVGKLLNIFEGVEYEEIKQDTIEFFNQLVDEGFLDCGEDIDECNSFEERIKKENINEKQVDAVLIKEECSKDIFDKNDFLRSIHVEILSECNERCVHCYIPHAIKNKVMESSMFFKLIEDSRAMNVINVTISGGEPLLHKDFIKFLVKCRELDLSVNVLSNLTMLSDEIVSEMKKNPLLSVQTSIYSMNSVIHDSITKVKGSLEKTKNSVLKLCLAGIPVQISCPIMKQNKDSFQSVIEWGNEYNLQVAIDYVIFAEYGNYNSNLVNRLSVEEVETAFEQQFSEEYAHSLSASAESKCNYTINDPVCTICRYYLCISAEGDVFPCVGWQTNKIGNLNSNSIREVWETSKKVEELRNIKWESFPKCIKCEDRGYCTVCMMCNSNENGNAFETNDFHCKIASMMHAKVNECIK